MQTAVDTEYDLDRIAAAVGEVPRVAYEGAHVYPLSAPDFTTRPGHPRPHPSPGPLKVYVHVPFCRYACTFCFYAKRIDAPRAQMERYVAALEREIEWVGAGTPLRQLYVGGGTPTALPADLLDRVLGLVLRRMPVEPGASMTVETSPESITPEHVEVLKRHGIDRVSMGVETLDEKILDAIHRRHAPAQALDACSLLVRSGLTVNVDLIYALPGQTRDGFVSDLEAIAARRPHSLTLYNLRLNEHTPLARVVGELDRLDLAGLMRWRALVVEATAALGYVQTRWHTFLRGDVASTTFHRPPCVEGAEAGRQVGLGVSAVSHLDHVLFRNHEGFDAYLGRVESGESPVEGVFELDEADRRSLFFVHSLGDGAPLDTEAYARTFGRPFRADFAAPLERSLAAGLVREEEGGLNLTPTGRLLYDLVTLAFYPDHARAWLDGQQSSTNAARGARNPVPVTPGALA